MFCPRCRKFTSTATSIEPSAPAPASPDNAKDFPQSQKSSAPWKALRQLRARAGEGRCAQCNTLLTLDRLASEFPDQRRAGDASGQAALTAPGDQKADPASAAALPPAPVPDAPVTVQELLRATAGPNPISGVGQIPLDQRQPGGGDRRNPSRAGGRREDDVELSGSRYQASETAQRRNRERKQREMDTDWRQADAPRIPRGFGGKQWTRPNLEVVLGLGTLAAVALLVVSMTLRLALAPSGAFAPAPHPMAQVVNASALGYVPARGLTAPIPLAAAAPAAAPDAFAATPAFVSTEWRRVGQPVSVPISLSSPAAGQTDLAAYEPSGPKGPSRVSPVRVWVQHLKSSADALACLTVLVSRRQELQVAELGLRATAVRWETIAGRKTAVLDAAVGADVLSDTPGDTALGSLRAWQQGNDVVTVAADDAANRDNFAKDYLQSAS